MLLECASPAPDAAKLAELARNVNWPELLGRAEDHGVLGHLATRLHAIDYGSAPEAIKQLLRERHRAQLFHVLKMSAELFRLMDRFTAAGIESLVIKGPVLAVQAYADPGMRSYNDLDLLVRPRDIPRATEVMIAEGYEPKIPVNALVTGKIPGQYFFHHPDSKQIVELHNENTLRYFPRPLPLEKVFQRRISVRIHGREVPALSVEDGLVLICIHGAKHFWERLMWIADVAGLVSLQQGIDWERASAAADEVGAGHMLHAGLQLASTLLKTPLPAKIAAKVRGDGAARRIAEQVVQWLPAAGTVTPSLLQRALFRMRMRGGLFSALAYLLRLSLSPTEDDWGNGAKGEGHWLLDALRRPFRLARKYGRER
ncbi:MAG: hypothetical protein PVS2B2_02420 [Candidatus Acidiferrum sp.]